MSYWVGVDDNLNNGWPKIIQADSKPAQYVRVYGPYTTREDAQAVAENLPTVTTGYRAVCLFSQRSRAGQTVYSQYPLNSNQYERFYGPYDTESEANVKALTLNCPFVIAPAMDVCTKDPEYNIPPTLKCSLVCSALAWPMTGGTINITFYRRTCYPGTPERSEHLPGSYSISLGCAPSEADVGTSTWIGRSNATNVLIIADPPRGYTVRFAGTMTVVTANQVAVSVRVDRLIAGIDLDPENPPPNQWSGCSSFSATCNRVVGPGVDPDDRTLVRTYTSNLVPVTFSSQCATDVTYAQVSVILTPMRFGCDGTSNGGTFQRCGLNSNRSSYSCFVAHVIPENLTPQTVQLGVNGTGASIENGCFAGSYSVNGAVSLTPSYSRPAEILIGGCPDERPDLPQQIQLGSASDFEIILKSVDKGNIWCGIRRGLGYAFQWKILSNSTSITLTGSTTQQFAHRVKFTDVVHETGNKNVDVYLYALHFPPPIIDGCQGNDHASSGTGATETGYEAPTIPEIPPEVSPTIKAVQEAILSPNRFPLRCIHLGPILKRSCCGAPSLHECLKGLGNCRPNGAAWTDDEISCCTCKHKVVQSEQE